MIDLMKLAEKSNKTYLDAETSFGLLRVYHVPDIVYLSVNPDNPEPELPMVAMKTAIGVQYRDAKPSDDEYKNYQTEKASYDEIATQLHVAIGMVAALKDIDWSQYDLSKPPPIDDALEMYKDNWPDNELLRKKAWLDWTVFFKRGDRDAVLEAINQMRDEFEPTEEMVEQVKKNSV